MISLNWRTNFKALCQNNKDYILNVAMQAHEQFCEPVYILNPHITDPLIKGIINRIVYDETIEEITKIRLGVNNKDQQWQLR